MTRALGRLAVFASCGLLMTALVAFLCAAFVDGSDLTIEAKAGADLRWVSTCLADSSSACVVLEVRGLGLSRESCVECQQTRRRDDPLPPPIQRARGHAASITQFAEKLRGTSAREVADYLTAILELNAKRISAGWPLLAFRGSVGPRLVPLHGWPWLQVQVIERDDLLPMKARLAGRTIEAELPVRPVWQGIALDTAFYAGALWLATRFPFIVRRAVRARRGLCPGCAYPIGLSPVCTECGRHLARRSEDSTFS